MRGEGRWGRPPWRSLLVLAGLASCGPATRPEPTPHAVFDAFRGELDRSYAVFAERLGDVDWIAHGADTRAELPRDATAAELVEGLVALARPLRDGHLTIDAPGGPYGTSGVSDVRHEGVDQLEFMVARDVLGADLQWGANEWIGWGRADDVGYLSITAFEGYVDGDGEEADDLAAVDAVLDRVVTELGDVRGLIVDVRANGGGWDSVALGAARWFEGPRTLAWTKEVRTGPDPADLSEPVATYVAASVPRAFRVPVVLLTSGATFSAGETFVLALRERPGVTVIGEPTAGALSDLYEAELPNGWTFTYSGERYRAADGEVYEGRGIPPDVHVPTDVPAALGGRDPQIRAALELLRAR